MLYADSIATKGFAFAHPVEHAEWFHETSATTLDPDSGHGVAACLVSIVPNDPVSP
jgi:hypothetical protein